MRTRLATVGLLIAAGTSSVITQGPAQTKPVSPSFDVVSIKRNVVDRAGGLPVNPSTIQRPDGGFTMTRVPVAVLISRAYPPNPPADMVDLPEWALREFYDVSATSPLSKATPDDRIAMLRQMLVDRFKLSVHFEKREQSVFDLRVARIDGTLGPNIKPVDADCDAKLAADRAAAEAALQAGTPAPRPQFPDLNSPPPPCTLRSLGGRDPSAGVRLEGETSMANLASFLRAPTGRVVVDKTGLKGSYSVSMRFDRMFPIAGPDLVAPADGPASIFTAIREDLGLKLESSRAERDTLVIDRLERPTEN